MILADLWAVSLGWGTDSACSWSVKQIKAYSLHGHDNGYRNDDGAEMVMVMEREREGEGEGDGMRERYNRVSHVVCIYCFFVLCIATNNPLVRARYRRSQYNRALTALKVSSSANRADSADSSAF